MENVNPQPDLDPTAIGPILGALRQVLPGLEKLVEVCRDLLTATEDEASPSVCSSCEKKRTCTELCDMIPKALKKTNPGRGRQENLTGFFPDTLQPIQKIWRSDVFDQYEACKELFTPLQWETIYLHYNQGLTQKQVGEQLGKTRNAISGLLQRAKTRKEEHDKRIRAEKYEAIKKSINEDED